MNINKKSHHWSNYWQGGQLTSLPQDFKQNYDGMIKQEWIKSFNTLEKKSEILDLCTGNCAIALLASQYSSNNDKNFIVHAIDAADIKKSNILSQNSNQSRYLKNINITSNCKVEDIMLPSNSFDLITSQYGIEYTNWQKSAEIIYKLLKHKSEFKMICHANSTEIISYMNKEQENYTTIINIGLFRNFDRLAKRNISYRCFIQNIKCIQKIISIEFNHNSSELFHSILLLNYNIINTRKSDLLENSSMLSTIAMQHKHAYTRLQDLLNVSSKLNSNPSWYHNFTEVGLKLVKKKSIYYNKKDYSGELFSFVKL